MARPRNVPIGLPTLPEVPLRTDGPTLKEHIAAGGTEDSYPPEGYAEVDLLMMTEAEQIAREKRIRSEMKAELKVVAKAVSPERARIAESRKALEHPLPHGQKFFEAPDGFIIVAEAERPHVIYRPLNGKEMQINPRR